MYNVVFLGTPDFAIPSLESCLKNANVLAVVTQPDRKRGRGQKILPSPIKTLALEHKLPVFQPASLKKQSCELDSFVSFCKTNSIDFFVVTAYGNILPQDILDLPRIACVNVHASLLPLYRGAAPIQRCLESGDQQTGVSLQKMVLEMDAGDILLEESITIDSDESASSLTPKLSHMGYVILEKFLKISDLLKSLPSLAKVQDHSKITHAAKISKNEAIWNPTWTSRTLHNKIRAFDLWPNVSATLNAKEKILVKITKSALVDPVSQNLSAIPSNPGEIFFADSKAYVVCANEQQSDKIEALEIIKLKPSNKGEIDAFAYLQNLSREWTQPLFFSK